MDKKIKDYLQFYIGCDVKYPTHDGGVVTAQLTGFSIKDGVETTYKKKRNGSYGDYISEDDGEERGHETYVHNIKPILRPLSDMTEEDANRFAHLKDVHWDGKLITVKAAATLVNFLRSKFYDCDGLIEAGLAIAPQTLTQKNKLSNQNP